MTLWLVGMAILSGSAASVVLKKAVQNIETIFEAFLTGWLYLGGLLHVLGWLSFGLSLRSGPLSVYYPLTSITYVLAVLGGWLLFDEDLSTRKLIGSCLILSGAFLLWTIS